MDEHYWYEATHGRKPDGSETHRSGRTVVSFRPSAQELATLQMIYDFLPEGTWAAVFRWILEDPSTQQRVRLLGDRHAALLQKAGTVYE